MESKFDEFLTSVEEGVKDLAKETLEEAKEDALKDSKIFLSSIQGDLERWTKLIAKGDLTVEDFEYLVEGKENLAEMQLLKQKGLTAIKIQKFKKSLVDLVINRAASVFL